MKKMNDAFGTIPHAVYLLINTITVFLPIDISSFAYAICSLYLFFHDGVKAEGHDTQITCLCYKSWHNADLLFTEGWVKVEVDLGIKYLL